MVLVKLKNSGSVVTITTVLQGLVRKCESCNNNIGIATDSSSTNVQRE